MSTELQTNTEQETPESIQAETKAKLTLAVRIKEAKKEAAFVDNYIESINAQSKEDTEEQKTVRQVMSLVAPAPEPKVPALSAGRTQLADLSSWRYKTLPPWQQEFRNADQDFIVSRWLRGIGLAHRDGGAALREAQEASALVRADLAVGASTGGVFDGTMGDAIPLPVASYIQIALYKLARMRGLVRVFDAPIGSESLRIPLQSAISSSTSEGEQDAIAEGTPALASHLNLVLQKHATLAVLSNEAIETGSGFGLIQWLINDVTTQMADREDTLIYSSGAGAASDQPRGLEAADDPASTSPAYFVATLTQVADFNKETLVDYLHIVKMFYALPEFNRRNAIWSGPDSVMQALSLMLDANGRPIFLQASEPGGTIGDQLGAGNSQGSILGRPVMNLPGQNVALTAAAVTDTDDNRLYFWNPLRTIAMLEQSAMRIEASRDDEFKADNTVYKFVRRFDSGIMGNVGVTGRFDYVFGGGFTGAGTPIV